MMKIPTTYRPLIILLIGVVLVAAYAWWSDDISQPTESEGLAIQTWTTKNGARVYFVPATSLPMVDVRVVFDAGSARDGTQHGVARLSNALLSQGAGDWDAQQLAERFEDVGANFGSDALRDMAV
ncbi:MAG: insulinase family protein, partial [Gammaproteobacteria bacterium]